MSHRPTLVVLMTLVAVLGLLVGTGGVSSVTSVHTAAVDTATDHNAFLGFEQAPHTTNGTTALVVTIINQYPVETAIKDLEIVTNGTTVELLEHRSLDPGASTSHTFESVSCGERLTVRAVSGDMTVEIERSVECH